MIWRSLGAVALVTALGASAALAAGGTILSIEIRSSNPNPKRPTAPVNNLQELMAAFVGCWSPPPVDPSRQPLDLTFQLSFKRSGELFGKPRTIDFARPVTDDERQRYYRAVAEAVDLCSQMPFTVSMGGAVAGRYFRVNFLDRRNSSKAEVPWLTTKS